MPKKYPARSKNARNVVVIYIIKTLALLSPIGEQPDKNKVVIIEKMSIVYFVFFIIPHPHILIKFISSHTFSHTFNKKIEFPTLKFFKSVGIFCLLRTIIVEERCKIAFDYLHTLYHKESVQSNY